MASLLNWEIIIFFFFTHKTWLATTERHPVTSENFSEKGTTGRSGTIHAARHTERDGGADGAGMYGLYMCKIECGWINSEVQRLLVLPFASIPLITLVFRCPQLQREVGNKTKLDHWLADLYLYIHINNIYTYI